MDSPTGSDLVACPRCKRVYARSVYCAHECNQASLPQESLKPLPEAKVDPVNHPPHYNNHPSGVECVQITEHMNFCIGNAIKYLWRADEKGNAVEDLEKAAWYVQREIARRKLLGETH